jgi:hypothetical protein
MATGDLEILIGDQQHSHLPHVLRMQPRSLGRHHRLLFPVWMICLAAGVVGAFIERALLLRYRLENQVRPLWLFYPCSVTLCACLLWLMFYR